MGCDIHCVLEYKITNSSIVDTNWYFFNGRSINTGRSYGFFSRLAGVRSSGYNETSIAAGRGIPKDASYPVNTENSISIDSDTSRINAARWVDSGMSSYLHFDDNGIPTCVSNPDYHSHSWATLAEWKKAMGINATPEAKALACAAASFEHSGYETRIVFWFDN